MLKTHAAKRKHIVLLSDGKSDGAESDFLELAAQIADARISLTTIAIGDANRQLLTKVAETGEGQSIFVENIQQLPEVLTEAVRETRRYIVQEPFQPVIAAPSEPIVAGIGHTTRTSRLRLNYGEGDRPSFHPLTQRRADPCRLEFRIGEIGCVDIGRSTRMGKSVDFVGKLREVLGTGRQLGTPRHRCRCRL